MGCCVMLLSELHSPQYEGNLSFNSIFGASQLPKVLKLGQYDLSEGLVMGYKLPGASLHIE